MNSKLLRRPTRKNVKNKTFIYVPKAVTANKNIPDGASIYALEDAVGDKNKTVTILYDNKIYTVFLDDLAFK